MLLEAKERKSVIDIEHKRAIIRFKLAKIVQERNHKGVIGSIRIDKDGRHLVPPMINKKED